MILKYFCQIICIFLLLLFLNCQWLHNRIYKDQNITRFHKRVIWNNATSEGCEKDFIVTKIKIINNLLQPKVYFLAENAVCSILFIFKGENTQYFLLNSVIKTQEETFILDNLQETIKITDIGWGKKIYFTILSNNKSKKYEFTVYLKEGIHGDPFFHFY